MATRLTDQLRKVTKQVQEHRASQNEEGVKRTVEEYDDTLERWGSSQSWWCITNLILYLAVVPFLHFPLFYSLSVSCAISLVFVSHLFHNSSYIPVLMAQAKIYWDHQNYPQVERIFRKSVEFCSEHDTWKLNVAHVLFMQVWQYKQDYACLHCSQKLTVYDFTLF